MESTDAQEQIQRREDGPDHPRGRQGSRRGRGEEARRQRPDHLPVATTVRTMGVDDAKRLKSLEQENLKLKKLLVDRMLDIEVLKDINAKKW
jgi:hypothetical protein